jgi:hypothetical protein
MGVWEYGSVKIKNNDLNMNFIPILPYSHTPILPYSHTFLVLLHRPFNTTKQMFEVNGI